MPAAKITRPGGEVKLPSTPTVLPKVRRRLIPLLFLLYIVSYVDRINVGFAALQMNQTLGLSSTAFGLGAGIFFLSYTLFEIPSNVILARVGARRWIARIMITWGLASSSMMFARTVTHFYLLRFLLGAAEAGFFPGIIYYLTEWFPRRERARSIAGFMTATLVAGIVGGPVSGVLLSLHGAGGLAGWQWLFLLEGLPAIGLGFAVLWLLPDRPRDAKWLSEAERVSLEALLQADVQAGLPDVHSVRAALANRRIWLLAAVYFTIPVALYAIGFWLPQMIKSMTSITSIGSTPGTSDLAVGIFSAIPYLVGAVAMTMTARHYDRTGERRWHIVIAALVGGCAFALSAAVHSLSGSLVTLSFALGGLASMFGPFWALATSSLGGVGAAAGIALINSIGNTGGFVGPYLVGYIRDATDSFAWGLVAIGVVLAFVPMLVLTVDEPSRRS
jgi:ACS family tartrate transporter-like MFS transporter